jgi:hypothetical protein
MNGGKVSLFHVFWANVLTLHDVNSSPGYQGIKVLTNLNTFCWLDSRCMMHWPIVYTLFVCLFELHAFHAFADVCTQQYSVPVFHTGWLYILTTTPQITMHPVPFLCPWPVHHCGGHQICCQANFTVLVLSFVSPGADGKLSRVDAQSPVQGSQTSQQQPTQSAHQQTYINPAATLPPGYGYYIAQTGLVPGSFSYTPTMFPVSCIYF